MAVVFFPSAFHFSLCSRAPHTHWRALLFKKSVNVCSLYDADCQCIHTFESVFLFVRWTIDALLASRWSLKYYNTSTIRIGISMFYISISIEFAHSFKHFIALCATTAGLARFEHCDWAFVLQLWMDGIYFLSWFFFLLFSRHTFMDGFYFFSRQPWLFTETLQAHTDVNFSFLSWKSDHILGLTIDTLHFPLICSSSFHSPPWKGCKIQKVNFRTQTLFERPIEIETWIKHQLFSNRYWHYVCTSIERCAIAAAIACWCFCHCN